MKIIDVGRFYQKDDGLVSYITFIGPSKTEAKRHIVVETIVYNQKGERLNYDSVHTLDEFLQHHKQRVIPKCWKQVWRRQ